jgi:hypothetical protein
MNMLDTVILTIPENSYKITKPDFFKPNAEYLYKPGFIGKSFINNFKTKDKYYPRLTITPRSKGKGWGTSKDLRIEFSACKLVHGNNLKELLVTEDVFVYRALYNRLLETGVELLESPANFEVSGFDTAKNIFLSKGLFSSEIIKELSKCEIDRRLDLDTKAYNESAGTTLQFYSNNHSLVVYDKLADLKKPGKRAVDKDRNDLQRDLFEEQENQEIIRFEARLRKKIKMKQILAKIGYKKTTILFKDLFDERLWQRILDYYWQNLIAGKNRFLFNVLDNLEILIDKILILEPETGQRRTLTLLGIYYLAKQKGLAEFRKIYEHKLKGKQWSKLKSDFDLLNSVTETKDCFDWFREIDEALSLTSNDKQR